MKLKSLCAGMVWGYLGLATAAHAGDVFMKPTPEELAMKELPGYPGAAAVVLFREEITTDDLHSVQRYERVKILTEKGKDYANVELHYFSLSEYGYDNFSDDKTVGEIVGRTVHPDGTVIPFTGKPYLKTAEKGQGLKYQVKVFTLPDVEVGSIIEYRYTTRYDDNAFESPDWYIQGPLFVRAAHYVWQPTKKELIDSKQRPIDAISWFNVLPAGVSIVHTEKPRTSSMDRAQQMYELTINNVPPVLVEDFQPPTRSFTYRVLFNFTSYRSADDYWKSEGKDWSRKQDSFANPNGDLKTAADAIVAGATTEDEKLQKIYAAVMAQENTHFTREREQREDKAEGEKIKSAADILKLKRGNKTQLTELFVGMARAEGMKAYLMLVPDRSEELFVPQWLSFRQFDDEIAIVKVDGKEKYFDPGWRYEPYGHLAWEHTFVNGLRQTDNGTNFELTPGDDLKFNRTLRVANLQMDNQGQITGKIDVTYIGSAAVSWRHRSLAGDTESLHHALRTSLESMLAKSLEVKVEEIKDLETYEKPLVVSYQIKGTLGTPTGKRLVMPVDLFETGSSATFPHEKREQPVYFHFTHTIQDAVRVNFTDGFEVEALPPSDQFTLPGKEIYDLSVTAAGTNFTTRRNHLQGELLVQPKDYDALRKFYAQMESKDQESVVLKVKSAGAAAPGGN